MSNTDLAKIIANSNTKLLCDFINHYGYSKHDMLHYLLKYTYVENWSNEVLEDYGSVRWELFLEDVMRDCGLSTRIKGIYCNSYIQEWRRNKVLEDFDIDLAKLYKCTHCDFIGEIKTVTISKTVDDKYYVSLLVNVDEINIVKAKDNNHVIGIDMGLKSFIVTSEGKKYNNPKYFTKLQDKLAREQRKLSHMVKGSSNRNKQRIKVARLHQKIQKD